MSTTRLELKEINGLEAVSLVDNSADFLSSPDRTEVKTFMQWTKKGSQYPIAEHGFSMLIRASCADKKVSVLFDAGVSPDGVVENATRMGIDLGEVDFVVLSHGHYDHFGGLASALRAIGKPHVPLIVHEHMLAKRGSAGADGTVRVYQEFPALEKLSGAKLIKTKQSTLIGDGAVLVTGEIPRKTGFEAGFKSHMTFVDGVWQPDPLILDDRAIAFNVKGKGLVVISGCAHAGIINTVKYAQQVSGVEVVYAVLGGFHLAGKSNEDRIEATVEELKRINPKIIVPSHCTGWKAMCAIAKTLPAAFVWGSVGNLYRL